MKPMDEEEFDEFDLFGEKLGKKEICLSDYTGMSILQLMEKVTDLAEDSQLTDCFFDRIRPLAALLGGKLDLTPEQAVLYSIFIDNYDDNQIQMSHFKRHTGARIIRIAQLQDDIDILERKRYIRRTKRFNGEKAAYYVPFESIKSLRENKAYVPKKLKNLSFRMFIREVDKSVDGCYNLGEPYDLLLEDLIDLMNNNMSLRICQQLDTQRNCLSEHNWVLLVALCTCELFHGQRFGIANISKLLGDEYGRRTVHSIEDGYNELQTNGLIEFGFSDGIVDTNCIVLTRKAKKMLLSENKKKNDGGMNQLIKHNKIAVKPLFYDTEVKNQVEQLSDLLSQKSFTKICKRMKQHGMRLGFACLFYGAPGTGKTETVLQLAKKTGRDIIQVDFSHIKDKYVGESEKNIKAVFDNYREAVNEESRCPILLFNEADAIIGKRLENVEHSVDNMYNSIQNIILQEMENFEGILIATTNLEGNMDSAFERRFLYKVRFEKPTPEVRKQIWQSIIPALSDETALALAKEFEFSGGQIENIARKQVVDNILYGEKEDQYASLKEYCNNETIQNRKSRLKIGFAA